MDYSRAVLWRPPQGMCGWLLPWTMVGEGTVSRVGSIAGTSGIREGFWAGMRDGVGAQWRTGGEKTCETLERGRHAALFCCKSRMDCLSRLSQREDEAELSSSILQSASARVPLRSHLQGTRTTDDSMRTQHITTG